MRKRWKRIAVVAVLIAIAAFCVNAVVGRIAGKKRQAQYESQLAAYRAAVKIGTTRADLENYLQSRSLQFRHICCALVTPGSGWEDLVKIASGDPPWYCNYSNIYIAFEFPRTADNPLGSDRLQNIELFPYLEECM